MYESTNRITNKEGYYQITKRNIPNNFEIIGDRVYLKDSNALPFVTRFPLILDEDIAKISAMILDGSISKNLTSCTFSQKKDRTKPKEFNDIIKKIFGLNGRVKKHKHNKVITVTFSRKTFVMFLYRCLNIHKSDESARIPRWVWLSPKSVIKEYIRYAFAMEGSISHYLKTSEIKFHSVDLDYILDLKKILKEKFEIISKVQKYHIRDYGWKYYLYFCDKDNIIRFNQIGFALATHQKRLKKLISSFKNKAWEITLVKISGLNKKIFTSSDVNKMFKYLCKRAVHSRLCKLVAMNYLTKEKGGYSFTKQGSIVALSLRNKVKITKLRTSSHQNESAVIEFLNKRDKSYRNEIARELEINVSTIRDTLNRLIKKHKIRYLGSDKFQRRFYSSKDIR